ncbi:hypothetical protein PTKIN_Ptkin02bG0161900 [Pterospermum kingtungense]
MNEEQEMKNKRKNNHQEYQVSKRLEEYDEEDNEGLLTLSLSYGSRKAKVKPPEEPLDSSPPTTFSSKQQELEQHLSMQYPVISQSPVLRLSASHPLYSNHLMISEASSSVPDLVVYSQESSSSVPFVYPPETVSSASLSVNVPCTGTVTGTGSSRPVRKNPETVLSSSSVPFVYPQDAVQPPPSSSSSSATLSVVPNSGASRGRKNSTQAPREGKNETVPAPFPWATTHRATVHSIEYLLSRQIITIIGDVQCKRCEQPYEISYDLKTKFAEIGSFIAENKNAMHERAPPVWMNPVLPKCRYCHQENSVKPLISVKKKSINWLFLLLGQMLGCCTLDQLKYFCKHTQNHRTGAKDRVLFLTYLGLCKQLDPSGPFDR